MMLCVITPLFISNFLYNNKKKLSDQTFIGLYTYLFRDFKENIYSVYFHVIFLVRRLGIVVSVHLLHFYPVAQVVVCSALSWIVISI